MENTVVVENEPTLPQTEGTTSLLNTKIEKRNSPPKQIKQEGQNLNPKILLEAANYLENSVRKQEPREKTLLKIEAVLKPAFKVVKG